MRTETMSNIHYWGLQERKAVVGVSDVNFIEWIRTEEASQSEGYFSLSAHIFKWP